jgi:hypothetical protein
VTQGNSDSIGSIDWSEGLIDPDELLHHALHLLLIGRAVPGNRAFDLVG